MPTGYTSGILNGSIKTFREFALVCADAFIVARRDNKIGDKWVDAVPDPYYKEDLEEAKKDLAEFKLLNDDEIVKQEASFLRKEIKRINDFVKQEEKEDELIKSFLSEAQKYKPKDKSLKPVRDFMIEQLELSLRYDDGSFYIKCIEDLSHKVKNLDIKDIKEKKLEVLEEEVVYRQENLEQEIANCKKINTFYHNLKDSLQ